MRSDEPSDVRTRKLTDDQKRAMVQTLSALIATYIAEDANVSIEEAFGRFYASPVAAQLDDLSTLLYREGPGYIYDIYNSESADDKK